MAERESSKSNLPPELDTEARSNAIRLTGRQWIGIGLFAIVMIVATPTLWKQVEKFDLEPDYRMPKDLSNDYWLYARYSQLAASSYDTLVIGDSVVWGEYVTRRQTLSHYLNQLAGGERFANLGLDGAHPVALAGLVEFYAASGKGKNVLLHCNPWWITSARLDLQEKKEFRFNHPRLVPQFSPQIPCYPLEREKLSERIGIVVEQRVPFESWAAHLQQAYYRDPDGTPNDIPNWTLEHPYANPVAPLKQSLPASDYRLHNNPITWTARGIKPQEFDWVDLDTSLQWRFFQRTVEILQQRGNRVFVLVGPFNEHLLLDTNLKEYQKVKSRIESWLQQKGVSHLVPLPLKSDLFADASHPLADGYAELARQLFKSLPR